MSTPKVWSRFSAIRKSSGNELKFRVQEGTTNEKDEVLKFLVKYGIPRENFMKGAGVFKSDDAIKELVGLFDLLYDKIHVTICYEDKEYTDAPIIGLNMVSLEKGEEESIVSKVVSLVKTPEVMKLLNLLKVAMEKHDEAKKTSLCQYYFGKGLFVHPDYCGMGIGTEFLRIRRLISKEHGVPATGAWMTAVGSQKAAEKDGWITTYEIPFEELGRLSECDFNSAPPICKMMFAFVDV